MEKSTLEQLSHFFTLSLDLFCVADSEGYFRILNPAWQRTLGYSIEEMTKVPYIHFVHPEDVNATVEAQQSLEDGQMVLQFENRYLAKDGTWKWLSWKAVPQTDGNIYAVARDITTQKEDEKATLLLLRKLEQSNQELDQFAFIVSHDLKSPLRSIINLSQWIQEDLGDSLKPEVAEQITLLQGRVERMQQLIEDLLQYAKTGRGDKPQELINLNDLIEEIRQSLVLPADFEIKVPKPLKPIMGRPVEVYQLFQNLIANAVKYRSTDHGKVEITQTNQRDFWQFAIQDDGIGIDPRHHKRIFQVFQRLSVDDTAGIEGTGIGLSLVQKIVESMGGTIEVRSQLGHGSTFLFTWPK